jgi:Ca2+-binding RTX toxin-like protein
MAAVSENITIIQGTETSETLTGTAGDDILKGDLGSDTYRYAYNGTDIIEDAGGEADVLYLTTRDAENTGYFGNSYFFNGDLIFESSQSSGESLTVKNALGDGRVEYWTYHSDSGSFADHTFRISSSDDDFVGSDIAYFGTLGDDAISMNDGYNEAYGSDGNDTIRTGDGGSWVEGGAGNDRLYGNVGNDALQGGTGNDWLYGEGGDDQIDGGEGFDRVDFRDSTAAVNVDFSTGVATGASIGSDTLTSIERAIGSNYNDALTGSNSDEGFTGELGDDSIDGGGGWDFVWYGRAGAAISADLATGVVTGGEGTDFLSNIEGIMGSNFGDTLIGSDSADWFRPDQVNDLYTPNYSVGGNDYIDGKEGVDTVSYYGNNAAVEGGTFTGISANLSTGVVIDELGNTDTLINIEDLTGSRYNDIIVGNDVDNVLDGRGGDDELTAGSGNDWIQAGDGDDIIHLVSTGVWSAQYSAQNVDTNLSYGTGEQVTIGGMLKYNHVLDGGLNNDILYLQDGNDAFFLDDMFSGFNTASLEAGQVGVGRIASIEELRAGDGDDIIDLTSLVYGLVDNTSIYGEGGNDHLWAADGNDNIYGGDGNDSINGGAGNDVLSGGVGADKFQFTATSGADQIVDFQVSEGDELHFYYHASSVSDVNDLSMAGGVLTWATGDTGSFVTVDMSNTIVVDDVPTDLLATIVFHEIV